MHPTLLFLNSIYPLSSACIEALEDLIQEMEIRKRAYILRPGQVCTNVYFIHSGLMRSFIKEGDKVICRWFMKEGDIIISIKSFYNQTRTEEYIQALEDSTLSYVSFADLEKVYNQFLEFNYVGRILTQKYYQLWDEQLKALHHPAWDRYVWLKENHPQFIQRVSTEDIASYLGITREHLQRIKYKM